MITLILSVCSIVEGATCHELPPIPMQPEVSLVGCLTASQIEGAKWIAAHPNFYIGKATCRPAGRFEQI